MYTLRHKLKVTLAFSYKNQKVYTISTNPATFSGEIQQDKLRQTSMD